MAYDFTYPTVALALLVAAFVKGATGFGFPLIATPTVALLLDIRTAVTILILPNLFMDSAQVIRDGFPYAILRRFKGLIAPTIVGVFLGTLVLVKMPLWVLNLCLGAMLLIFVIASMFKWEFTVSAQQEKFLSPLVGLLSGFLNGVTNAAGPALAIYLYGLKVDKRTFVKSLATIFVTTKLSQLAAISTWNLLNWYTIKLSVLVLLFSLTGFYAGLKTQDRVDQAVFNRGLLVLLALIGLLLIVRAGTQGS
ncbi:MAG: sulfite exporter TauE/SafE family protein [Candidatus Binatia bacterium]